MQCLSSPCLPAALLPTSPGMSGHGPVDLSELHSPIQIFVKSIWFNDHLTLMLDVDVSDSVATVKAHVHNVTGIMVEDQHIYLENEKLADTESLGHYGIGDGMLLTMWLDEIIRPRTWMRVIVTKTNTEQCYEFMRKGEKVGNIGCRLCWCWMAPACEASHWNSKNKHGKRLRNYTGPPDPNNFREVKMSAESVENEEAENGQDGA